MPQSTTTTADFLPPTRDISDLAAAAQACRGCALYKEATQVVFGAGSPSARMMFVGEQPGDREGRPAEVDPRVVVTIHPSAVLRGPGDARAETFSSLVDDLRFAAAQLED